MSFSVESIRDLYPFESHYLDLNGLRMHYLDEGQGDPVVMVHGNPTWSFMYRKLVVGLRDQYRVIVPDHIGCGPSDKPSSEEYSYRFDDRVRDVERLLDHLALDENVTLAVHDWGGLIGFAVACRNPERIKQLVVFNTAAFVLPDPKVLHWSIRVCRTSKLAAYLIQKVNLFARVAGYMGPVSSLESDVRQAFTAPYDSWENRIGILRFIQDIPLEVNHPSYPLLEWMSDHLQELVDKPMLICWGERDFVFSQKFLEEWVRRFPDAEVRRFPKAGHYVLEDAASEIVPIVKGFLGTVHPDE